MSHNLRKRCKNNKLFFFSNQYIIAMDYELLEKMKVEELKNYFAREEKKETIKSFTKNEVWSTEKLWFKAIEYNWFCWS